MKHITFLLLLILPCFALAQVEDTPLFVGKYFGNQSGGGAGYWEVTGNFTDESGYYDATGIQIGDVLFFSDSGKGYHLPVTNIVSASGSSFVIRVNNTGIAGVVAVPNGLGAIYRPSATKALFPYTSGLLSPDQQTLNNYLIEKIEGLSGGGITALTGDVTASGTGSVVATIANNSVTGAKVASQTLDSADVKQRGLTLEKLAQSGATNGQVPKYNSTSGKWEAGNDNSGSSSNYDNYRLPGIYELFPATGLTANESVTNYSFASVNSSYYKFSTTALGTSSTEYGGWLANGTSGDSIGISAPFGVVIGDSQAEGHNVGHGRLHPGAVATFNRNTADIYGQISFTLRGKTRMRWFNHGIGGQTTDNIIARWRRDVLAETYDPGDSRGSKTLNRKPNFVIVIAGINDIYNFPSRSWRTTATNLEIMAKSARDNGIVSVFLNCPGDEIITELQSKRVDSLNAWFASGALQSFGAAVVDYNKWWRDPAYNDNAHGSSLIADDIHPTAIGYDSLANYIFRSAKLPVLTGIRFRNELSPDGFTGYSRPASINIQGVAHTISSSDEIIAFSTPLAWDSCQIKINSSTNITGTTYSGFSHIEWIYQNDTTGLVTRRPELYSSYQGAAYTPFNLSGNVISPNNTVNLLALGTSTAYSTATLLTVKSTAAAGNTIFNVGGSSNANILNVLDNGRVVVGSTSLGGYAFAVQGSSNFQSTASKYTNISGDVFTLYGAPQMIIQSTAVNTGGSGYTRSDFTWNGVDAAWVPHPTFGVNNTWSWKNLAGLNTFQISLANQGTVNVSGSLGVTPNINSGSILLNPTLSTNGSQQISPMVRWAGQGYATGAAVSRLVDFVSFVTPIQGTTPSGYLGIGSGINSSYSYDQFRFHSDGSMSLTGAVWADHAKTVGTITGTGSPEGVVTASIGSIFRRTDGGEGTSIYYKESGVGNTGWVQSRRPSRRDETTASTDGSGDFTVTFATAMPDASYEPDGNVIASTGNYTLTYHTIGTGGFKIRVRDSTTGVAVASTSLTFRWSAIDY